MNTHLHILHLPDNTEDEKTNSVSRKRLENLIEELEHQKISDYSIIEGFYEKINTKKAIHKGHRLIVELAKKQNFPNCIIAEDDIVFTSPNSYKYFINNIPESYDIFSGLMYVGQSDENNKILNGASGIMTLYSIHSRFYDFFLSLDVDTHIDRDLGNTAFEHEYYVCDKVVCIQRGGYSFNLKKEMYYDDYLADKPLYGSLSNFLL